MLDEFQTGIYQVLGWHKHVKCLKPFFLMRHKICYNASILKNKNRIINKLIKKNIKIKKFNIDLMLEN